VEIASTHILGGREQSSSISRAFALWVRIILSETPFLCCVYGGDGSRVMPNSKDRSKCFVVVFSFAIALMQISHVVGAVSVSA